MAINDFINQEAEIDEKIDSSLKRHFHYKLARELGQLGQTKCFISPEAMDIYHTLGERCGMIKGNIKVEPLRLWDSRFPGMDFPSMEKVRTEKS